MRTPPARRLWAAVVATALLLSAACTGRGPGGAEAEDPWSETALRYGMAPSSHPDVTFQPDVVIVAGGGSTVRSVTADGLTWRLDATADGADQLAPGKVMFVTGRGVGRVLDVTPEGGDLLVTIGPVDVTEVIRDGTFERTGIRLEEPVIYPAGEPFWAHAEELTVEDPDGDGTAGTGGGAVLGAAADGGWRSAPTGVAAAWSGHRQVDRPLQPGPLRGDGVEAKVANFSTYASATDGVGVSFHYDRDGTKLSGRVALTFEVPEVDFHLSIRGGTVTRAELVLSAGFGIRTSFEAGLQDGKRNISVELPIPAEFSFPIDKVLGVPLTFTISQTVKVRTAFGASVGTIKGSGEFSVAGKLGYGYADGTFGPRITENVKRKKSLINSLTGVPVGVMGLLIEHRVKFNVGFSAFVLAAGVYFELRTAYGATLGSALGAMGTLGTHFVECRGVGLGIWATFGIGYQILRPVVSAINKFLSLFNLTPINNAGGIHSKPYKIYTNEEVIPDVPLCRTPTA